MTGILVAVVAFAFAAIFVLVAWILRGGGK
jgi:hypothetical protein